MIIIIIIVVIIIIIILIILFSDWRLCYDTLTLPSSLDGFGSNLTLRRVALQLQRKSCDLTREKKYYKKYIFFMIGFEIERKNWSRIWMDG